MSPISSKRAGVPLYAQEFSFPSFTWTQSYIKGRFTLGEQAADQGADGLVFLMQEELAKPNVLGTWAVAAGPSSANGPAYTIVGPDGYIYGIIPARYSVSDDNAYILALLTAWNTMAHHLETISVMVGASGACENDGIWTYVWGAGGVSYIANNYDMIVIYHYPTTLNEANGVGCTNEYSGAGYHDAAHYINYWRNQGFNGQIAYLLDTQFSGTGSSDLAVITADFKSAADALRETDYIICYPYVKQEVDKLAPARLISIWNAYVGGCPQLSASLTM